jgi:hypothetical protein
MPLYSVSVPIFWMASVRLATSLCRAALALGSLMSFAALIALE